MPLTEEQKRQIISDAEAAQAKPRSWFKRSSTVSWTAYMSAEQFQKMNFDGLRHFPDVDAAANIMAILLARGLEISIADMLPAIREAIDKMVVLQRQRCAEIARKLHATTGVIDGGRCGEDIAAAIEA